MSNCRSGADVLAAIVAYNPDISRLEENIRAICTQVSSVYIYDNASCNIADIRQLVRVFDNAILVENGENIGISRTLNIAAKLCIQTGKKFLLTLDQDSVCPFGMVARLLECFADETVGLACPSYYDSNRNLYNPRHSADSEISYVKMAITSASLCSIEAYRVVGGFDEKLFVGGIDNDYCYALVCAGFKIAQVNTLLLDHELGVIQKTKQSGAFEALHNFTGIELFKKMSYKREASDFRVFHSLRAQTYLYRKHSGRLISLKDVAHGALSYFARSGSKSDTAKAIVAGVRAGFVLGHESSGEDATYSLPMSPDDQQRVLKGLLEEFNEYCAREKLTYYLIGGALIGAVRNGDLLPWDDDIDVAMKRDDFERMCANYTNSVRYELLTHARNPAVREGTAKLVDRRTYFDEDKGEQPIGVFMDIFPLDYFSGIPGKSGYAKLNHLLVKQYIYATSKGYERSFARRLFKAASKLSMVLSGGTERFLARLNKRLRHGPDGASHLVNWWGYWGLREAASVDVFKNTEMRMLGECACLIPAGFDEWLTNIYGDYMTPPAAPDHTHGKAYWKFPDFDSEAES